MSDSTNKKSRLEEALELETLPAESKQELKDIERATKDSAAIAEVANSQGGQILRDILKEECRSTLVEILEAKKDPKKNEYKVMLLLEKFESKFTLFETLSMADKDHHDYLDLRDQRLEEIIKG